MLPEEVLPASALEAVDAVAFFAGALAAGFASGLVFAGVEVADESCAAPEPCDCGAGELALCLACAGDIKIVAVKMAAAPHMQVEGFKKVGFCILIFWHPAPPRANE